MKLAMTLLVKNESDIIRHHLDFHLNAGVGHIIVTDNASSDGTRDILSEYDRLPEITVIDEPGDDYSQHRWVTRMVFLAREKLRAEWVANSDADEFWLHSEGDLRRAVTNTEAQMLYAPRFNMVYPFDREGSDLWFARLIFRAKSPLPIPRLDSPLTQRLPAAYFCLDLPKKALIRTEGILRVHQGNHSADFARPVATALADISIYHYPIRSAAQFEAKVRTGSAACARNSELPNEICWHWRRWYKMINEQGLEAALADALPSAAGIKAGLEDGTIREDRTLTGLSNLPPWGGRTFQEAR
jgi:hypothetical protein